MEEGTLMKVMFKNIKNNINELTQEKISFIKPFKNWAKCIKLLSTYYFTLEEYAK